MEMDPHTLQQILEKIYQQMRCPQCGKKVPIDFNAIKVVSEEAMLLQLKCEACNAYIVLQASTHGIEQLSAPPYKENEFANASTGLETSKEDLKQINAALEKIDGSFEEYFEKEKKEESVGRDPDESTDSERANPDTEIV